MGLIDRILSASLSGLRWLALPIALLLALQWPLREIVQAGSREANDLGQWLFALFVVAGVLAATRERAHIATDVVSARFPPGLRGLLARAGIVLAVLPWALFTLWAGAPQIVQSVRRLEAFPETANPGYFVVKLALGLLMLFVVLQALLDCFRKDRA